MTDKQIIIDGVDVSECRCLAYPEADTPMCTGLYLGCKDNNCEYKKWKRKEQECEQLSNAYEACKDSRLKAYNTIDMLEQECEELKRALKEKTDEYNKLAFNYDAYANMAQKRFVEKEQECERWKSNFNGKVSAIEELLQQLDQLKAENEQLKVYKSITPLKVKILVKTLTEIKELLLKTPTDSQEHCVNAKSVILQKISEVVDE